MDSITPVHFETYRSMARHFKTGTPGWWLCTQVRVAATDHRNACTYGTEDWDFWSSVYRVHRMHRDFNNHYYDLSLPDLLARIERIEKAHFEATAPIQLAVDVPQRARLHDTIQYWGGAQALTFSPPTAPAGYTLTGRVHDEYTYTIVDDEPAS